jgi:hypothetical protein
MGPIDCPETSVRNYHDLLRDNTEERSFQESLKVEACSLEIICQIAIWDMVVWLWKTETNNIDSFLKKYLKRCIIFILYIYITHPSKLNERAEWRRPRFGPRRVRVG